MYLCIYLYIHKHLHYYYTLFISTIHYVLCRHGLLLGLHKKYRRDFIKIWWVEGKRNTNFVQLLEFKGTVGPGQRNSPFCHSGVTMAYYQSELSHDRNLPFSYRKRKNRITKHHLGEFWWTAIRWTGTQCTKSIQAHTKAPKSLKREWKLPGKQKLKVWVRNRLTHMPQIHTHTYNRWQLWESDMPATTTGTLCLFYEPATDLSQGERRGGKLNNDVHDVTCKCTYNLKCLHVSKTFQTCAESAIV